MQTSFVRSLGLVVVVALTAGAARAGDPRGAQAEVDKAQLAMAAKKYVEAAEHMEKAFALDANPRWLANVGYARMMAGQQDRAVESLSAALADRNLQGDPRQRAVERLGKASAAKAFIARSDEARAAGDMGAAARAYDEAFMAVPIGPYALEAAVLWERAGDFKMAQQRYSQAAGVQDLSPDQQKQTVEALARVAQLAAAGDRPPADPKDGKDGKDPKDGKDGKDPKDGKIADGGNPPKDEPPASHSTVLPWVLVGSGAAILVGGVVMYVVGAGKASDLNTAIDGADSGVVSGMTRADALALESDANMFRTVGIIGMGVGLAAGATGFVLLLTDPGPETHGSVHVTGAPLPGGGLVSAFGHF